VTDLLVCDDEDKEYEEGEVRDAVRYLLDNGDLVASETLDAQGNNTVQTYSSAVDGFAESVAQGFVGTRRFDKWLAAWAANALRESEEWERRNPAYAEDYYKRTPSAVEVHEKWKRMVSKANA
jgi:hypothetical protein